MDVTQNVYPCQSCFALTSSCLSFYVEKCPNYTFVNIYSIRIIYIQCITFTLHQYKGLNNIVHIFQMFFSVVFFCVFLNTMLMFFLPSHILVDHCPSFKFLDFALNSGNISSIFFHCGESTVCRRRLSHFLPFSSHVRFFVSSLLTNNNLNLGIIGKYNNTLARGASISSSPLLPSSLFLNRDNPHVGNTLNATNSSLYNTQ